MNYTHTLNYLFSRLPMFHRIGAAAYKADLKNTVAICDLLGSPQNNYPSIHIGGTNGKGSVAHFLASILQEKGLKVGLFSSPHLKDFRERIRINGRMISKPKVTNFIQSHKKDFEKIQPSFFEMTSGLAFQHFKQEEIDIAVVEVGLGGRLDSTNVILPKVSVITNISYDHMQFLGDTLEKIAAEKAGIIKPKIPVVIGEMQEEIKHVFIDKAVDMGSEILFADSLYSVRILHSPFSSQNTKAGSLKPISGSRFYNNRNADKLILDILRKDRPYISNVISPLSGNYQAKNIITVSATCEMLKKLGLAITLEEIRKGIRNVIRNTGLKGRWQVLAREPLTICDTGHNEAGLRQGMEQIRQTPHKHLHFVFGVVNDKEIDHILTLLPKDATYYFCKANIPRGLDQEELRVKALTAGLSGLSYPSVMNAFTAAQQKAGTDDLIFIGGSTFVVAEVI